MCAPLAVVAAGMAALATTVGTINSIQQSNAQAKVADANAVAERNAAQQDQENTRQAAMRQYREIARVKGQQQVAAAANGVGLDFGTAADVVSDTDMLGREDIANIYRSGDNTLKGHDVNAASYGAQASAARSNAVMSGIAGAFSVGGSVLEGASQFGAAKGRMGSSGFGSSVDWASTASSAMKAGSNAYSLLPRYR